MMRFGVWSRLMAGGAVLLSNGGCSLIWERPPPRAAEQRTARAARNCGDIQLPLVDTVSTVAAVTWIAAGNRADDKELARAERAFGYSALGVFGASALWGYYVEYQCSALRRELAIQSAPKVTPDSAPAQFPASVLDYAFGALIASVAARCQDKGGTWELTGSQGQCTPGSASASEPQVELSFELGQLSKVVLRYRTPSEQLTLHYPKLTESVRKLYGPPTREAAPLSASCQASLASCVAAGERPPGSIWHWPAGSIEVVPVLHAERPVLELRYSRE